MSYSTQVDKNLSPTLFLAYQSIERYYRYQEQHDSVVRPLTISAIDAFLMHLIAAYYPQPFTVIDLAADATMGASTYFWAAQLRVSRVIVPKSLSGGQTYRNWREAFLQMDEDPHIDTSRLIFTEKKSDSLDSCDTSWSDYTKYAPILIIVDFLGENASTVEGHLKDFFDCYPDAIILMLPLGLIGESPAIEACTAFCRTHTTFRVMALRELSPFSASSEIGLLCNKTNDHVPSVLERIQQLYAGNFQFLTLVQHAVTAATTIEKLDRKIGELNRLIEGKDQYLERVIHDKDHHITLVIQQKDNHINAIIRDKDRHIAIITEEKDQHIRALEQALVVKDHYTHDLQQALAVKDQFLAGLESRLRMIEDEVLPWKNEYITNLELHVRNLASNRVVKASGVLRRFIDRK